MFAKNTPLQRLDASVDRKCLEYGGNYPLKEAALIDIWRDVFQFDLWNAFSESVPLSQTTIFERLDREESRS
jgi:hypothetical protein